jgi:hypothetical protein
MHRLANNTGLALESLNMLMLNRHDAQHACGLCMEPCELKVDGLYRGHAIHRPSTV